MENKLGVYAIILTCFLFFIILAAFVNGISSLPSEADSLNNHIPLAKSILDGTFLTANPTQNLFYPSSAEIILALLIILKLPLNIFNAQAVLFLFLVSYLVGKSLHFSKNYSLIFASALSSLYGIQRWFLTQKIDVWMLGFFLASFSILIKPMKRNTDYIFLGLSLGMLTGAKFTGLFFGVLLLFFYIKNFLFGFNFFRFTLFLVPYSLLGLFWYIRNYLGTGNPFYPQPFLMFDGNETASSFMSYTLTSALINQPQSVLSAFLSEYMIWSLAIIILPTILIVRFLKKVPIKNQKTVLSFTLLGTFGLLIYTQLPSEKTLDSVIFGVRYSFPAFVMFMIGTFYLAVLHKKEEFIAKIAVLNLAAFITSTYQPKLLLLFIPFALLFWRVKIYISK